MSHDWILDVLADLRAYALKNDLGALADELGCARQVATDELLARGIGIPLVCIEGRAGHGSSNDAGTGGPF